MLSSCKLCIVGDPFCYLSFTVERMIEIGKQVLREKGGNPAEARSVELIFLYSARFLIFSFIPESVIEELMYCIIVNLRN